jgi:phosphinothricin acetyltransferase
MPLIRPSGAADVPHIAAIYQHHVLTGTGTFEIDPPSTADMAARRDDVLGKGLPFLVLEDDGQVRGFTYCNWFKPRPAYRFSAEDSIYLDPHVAGRGWGSLLLTELVGQAERAGVRSLIAVIGDSGNAASIAVHRVCGFAHAGVLPGCGWKFGRWLDVVLMQRAIGDGQRSPPAQSSP